MQDNTTTKPGLVALVDPNLVTLPKAEVHVHLEGCFEIDDIVALAEEAGIPLPRPRAHLLEFGDLATFLEYLDWSCSLLQTREQLARAAYRFSQRMARSGVLYADAIFNPTHWTPWYGRLPEMIEAFDAGFREAEQEGLPSVGLCVSLLRQQTSQQGTELVETLLTMGHKRVVALSVDGNEALVGRTGTRFADAFRRAAAGGLRRTVHAGESSGPEGVWDAIQLLHADRIDHGVRAIEDPELVTLLAERAIPLGICPTSNIILGIYADLQRHPIERLRAAGVQVSINTDDPVLLELSLAEEYRRCVDAFDWSADDLRAVAATSITSSFASDDVKNTLLQKLTLWPAGAAA